jgi:hypothetical protein
MVEPIIVYINRNVDSSGCCCAVAKRFMTTGRYCGQRITSVGSLLLLASLNTRVALSLGLDTLTATA